MIKVLDFFADWCGPCKMMEPVLEELKKEFEEKVEFEKIDVQENQEKAAKYGVMSIPTFVIEKGGKEVGRKVGAVGKNAMREWLERYAQDV